MSSNDCLISAQRASRLSKDLRVSPNCLDTSWLSLFFFSNRPLGCSASKVLRKASVRIDCGPADPSVHFYIYHLRSSLIFSSWASVTLPPLGSYGNRLGRSRLFDTTGSFRTGTRRLLTNRAFCTRCFRRVSVGAAAASPSSSVMKHDAVVPAREAILLHMQAIVPPIHCFSLHRRRRSIHTLYIAGNTNWVAFFGVAVQSHQRMNFVFSVCVAALPPFVVSIVSSRPMCTYSHCIGTLHTTGTSVYISLYSIFTLSVIMDLIIKKKSYCC